MPEAHAVRSMFARIARRYDLLNHVLSVGIDRGWRKAVLRRLGELNGRRVLDVACGTGDLALVLAGAGARTLGLDFTHAMLTIAADKRAKARGAERLSFVEGDALALPVADGAFDAATIAFGLRNVADRARGLAELARVVKPGGSVLVLEFSLPPGRLVGAGYRLYFERILPRVGGWISGDAAAYRYLPETVAAWPAPETLAREMTQAGLVECGFERLTQGVACLSYGRKPPASGGAGSDGAQAR